MMSLFIDTSNFRLVVGVVDEKDNVVCSYYNEVLKSDLSVKVLEIIKECIDKANIRPNDIDKIYIVNGPGSFTGIRIGVTIAKTFAWSLDKKIIPISSLEVLASDNQDSDYVVSMIDARRGCVYAGIYDKHLNAYIPDKYISLEELYKKVPKNSIYVSDDEIDVEGIKKPSIDILKVINKHKCDNGVNPHELVPSYLKITEAEANLKEKNDKRD